MRICLTLFAIILLTACTPAAPPTPTATPPPGATHTPTRATPSATATFTPTATPSATPTPRATLTPSVTPTPSITPRAITLLRGPYLQSVLGTQAIIMWTTAEDAPGEVRYGEGESLDSHVDALSQRVEVDAPAPYQAYSVYTATLTDLAPGAVYTYQVFTGGTNVQAAVPLTLRAAPASGPLTFIAFGDSGNGSSEQEAMVAEIRTLDFDFALVAGDIAYDSGTYEQFERYFFGEYGNLLATHPFWTAPGNHDYVTDDASPYRALFTLPTQAWRADDQERYYAFDWGDAHIVALDTEDPLYDVSDDATDDMADWLAADLAATRQPWKLVFFHKSPYSSGPHGDNTDVQARLVPLFEQYGVDLVLTGHDHDYERTVPIFAGQASSREAGGITYIVTGGGGGGRYAVASSWFTAFAQSVIHVTRIQIAGCTLTGEAIAATGEVLDTFTLEGCR